MKTAEGAGVSHTVIGIYFGVTKDVARLFGGIMTCGAVKSEKDGPCGVATDVADVTAGRFCKRAYWMAATCGAVLDTAWRFTL